METKKRSLDEAFNGGEPDGPETEKGRSKRQHRDTRIETLPFCQFRSQAKRERERLAYQLELGPEGRVQTLPWDGTMDLQTNAENNGFNWGVEWAPRGDFMSDSWNGDNTGPFFNGQFDSERAAVDRPGLRWGHEGLETPLHQTKIPVPEVVDKIASRPYHQFLCQVSLEHVWLYDQYGNPDGNITLTALAHQSVRRNWEEDGIWSTTWDTNEDGLPGKQWVHEDLPDNALLEAANEIATVADCARNQA